MDPFTIVMLLFFPQFAMLFLLMLGEVFIMSKKRWSRYASVPLLLLVWPLTAHGQSPDWQGPRPPMPSQPQVLEIPPQPQPFIPRRDQAPARPRQTQRWRDRHQPDDYRLPRQQHERWCREQRERLGQAMNDQALRQQARIHRLDEQERQARQEHMAFHALFGGVPSAQCLWNELYIQHILEGQRAVDRLNDQALHDQAALAREAEALDRECR